MDEFLSIIPKEFVDEVGDHIVNARKSTPRKRSAKVPDAAVDECEKAHTAAKGEKKADNNRYSDRGWMSLVCRHDIPLFFANIDTPGEQQKYPVSLIMWLFGLLPSNATVAVLYDISCILDRSVNTVSRLTYLTLYCNSFCDSSTSSLQRCLTAFYS